MQNYLKQLPKLTMEDQQTQRCSSQGKWVYMQKLCYMADNLSTKSIYLLTYLLTYLLPEAEKQS